MRRTSGSKAKIDDTGTGILLYDTAGGSGTLKVQDLAGGTPAADLGLTKTVKTVSVDGTPSQAIDGAGTFAQSAKQSGLDALVARINGLSAGVTASTFFDGARLSSLAHQQQTGAGNDLLVDGSGGGLSFTELSKSRDAAIEFGGTALGSGAVVTSATNTFSNVISGVDLTVNAASNQNVSVTVAASSTDITSAVQDFVDAYNSIRSALDSATDFNSTDFSTGILFGSTARAAGRSRFEPCRFGPVFWRRATSPRWRRSASRSTARASCRSIRTSCKAPLRAIRHRCKSCLPIRHRALQRNSATRSTRSWATTTRCCRRRRNRSPIRLATNKKKIQDMSDALDRQRQTLLDQFAALESTVATLQANLQALSSFSPIRAANAEHDVASTLR